jgi:hypothetical protein
MLCQINSDIRKTGQICAIICGTALETRDPEADLRRLNAVTGEEICKNLNFS